MNAAALLQLPATKRQRSLLLQGFLLLNPRNLNPFCVSPRLTLTPPTSSARKPLRCSGEYQAWPESCSKALGFVWLWHEILKVGIKSRRPRVIPQLQIYSTSNPASRVTDAWRAFHMPMQSPVLELKAALSRDLTAMRSFP